MRAYPELQRDFREGLLSGAVPADVTARDAAEVARRFAVYRNNVAASLIAALRRRFPVIERLVGADFAQATFAAFARAHPPDSPLMLAYGAAMPAFLERFAPAAALPYLPDVARLECARGRAYHAADAAPLETGALVEVAARDPARLRFGLHPSVELLASRHPVFTIWAMNQPGATPAPIADWRPEWGLVARSGLTVITARLERDEAAFIGRLLAGATLVAATDAAGAHFDPAPALARLIGARLVIAAA